ncbi:MAG: COG1683: Uncharacterized conserved protein / FIG143828: Hypothetical protein YbgA [uncultured Sulfurovum sp.]|uniref:Uncharacterized protein n=1 Tax=uncultured Sulfurovum sp. TaxID=269237 RepID=A0A6S6TVF9_9BACT|nr:MAG: COG1683: Uncharacterized conserved protein / FIG143828: Hypothetical protein YbgA [uncultured Sulfurovum sp.]
MTKNVAISACLLGNKCRYDAKDNKNEDLLEKLEGHTLISFCPEEHAFGTPRPTMDLVAYEEGNKAISNESGVDLSAPVQTYAQNFFDTHTNIDLFIGKDRSPSCGVCSAKLYDKEKNLLSTNEAGLMAKEALERGIVCVDAEAYLSLSWL